MRQISKNIFHTAESKKIMAKLRSDLGTKGYKLRISYDELGDTPRQHIKCQDITTARNFNILVTITSEKILELSLGISMKADDTEIFYKYVLELAVQHNYSVFLLKNLYRESLPKTVPLNPLPTISENEILFFTHSYINHEEIYYRDINENYTKRKLAIIRAMKDELKHLSNKDKTFISDQSQVNKDVFTWYYYYKGYESDFLIEFHDKTLIKVDTLNYEKEIYTPDDVIQAFKEILELSYQQVKLKSLINPPKKHFKNFIAANINGYIPRNVFEGMFDILSRDMDPEEIEESILDSNKHQFKLYIKYLDTYLFRLFDYFFIIDNKDKVEYYKDFNLAQNEFKSICSAKEKESYEEKILNLSNRMSKLNP